MNYHIRLTRPYAILEPFFRHLQCEQLVVYEHCADEEIKRTHVHALVKGLTIQVTTMKARLTKLCGVWKKGDWSFVTKYGKDEDRKDVNDDLITYMSKGLLDPQYVLGFKEEDILAFKTKWVDAVFKEVRKPTYDDLVKQVITMSIGPISGTELLNNIIDVLNKHNVVCGRYKVRDIYDTVLRRTQKFSFINQMSEMLNFPVKKSF